MTLHPVSTITQAIAAAILATRRAERYITETSVLYNDYIQGLWDVSDAAWDVARTIDARAADVAWTECSRAGQ